MMHDNNGSKIIMVSESDLERFQQRKEEKRVKFWKLSCTRFYLDVRAAIRVLAEVRARDN